MLSKQLHTGKTVLNASMITPVRGSSWKPYGGLWTSTYDFRHGSGWVQWCLGEEFHVPKGGRWDGVVLTPRDDARILTIDTFEDLQQANHKYPDTSPISKITPHLDYTHIAQDYDGVHLTEEGQWRTRLTFPLSLYGWDCESTLWFRWCFTAQTPIRLAPFKPLPHNAASHEA